MDDGLVVPGFQDGMAAFAGEAGQIILVCNHEIYAHQSPSGAFGQRAERLGELGKRPLYDNGSGKNARIRRHHDDSL